MKPGPKQNNLSLNAHIEWHCEHCGTIRIINGTYGRKYVWHTTIIREGTIARFVGALWFDMRYLAPIRTVLRDGGFEKLLFTRINPKTLDEREVKIQVLSREN